MKKKLLFVNGHLNVGGVEKSLTDLLSHLDYLEYDVDLLLLEDKGDYVQQIPKQVNIIFFDIKRTYGSLPSVLLRSFVTFQWDVIMYRIIGLFVGKWGKGKYKMLRGLLSLNKHYDVAIAYRVGFCADIVAYVVNAKRKLVWWHHGDVNVSTSIIINYNEIWKYFDSVAVVSPGCKEMFSCAFDYPIDRIVVVPNMIDIDKIIDMAGNKSPYNLQNGKINIISVGRLYVEKHFSDAISVAKKLSEQGMINFHWYIIGDGDLRDELLTQIRELAVENYVTLLGKKDNPYPWIKYADIFVHPSYVESQGLTILEAMALGTPCIVSRSVGPLDFLVDGENGIMTDNNAYSLYQGVVRMLELKEKETIVQNAFNTVKEKFSVKSIVEIFNSLV